MIELQTAHDKLPRLKIGESVVLHGITIERVTYGYVIASGATRSLLDVMLILQRRAANGR